MKKLALRTLTPILAIAIALSACTSKKRDAALPYGEDQDLLAIADYSNKEFTVQTQDVQAPSQSKKSLKTKTQKTAIAATRAFDFVKYSDANDKLRLLDNSLFVGKTNHQYRMKYEFEGTLLKVYKMGTVEDLSAEEIATASEAGVKDKNLRKVPVVAYRVSYFTIENQRNEKNEQTSILKLTAQNSPTASTHFKIDYNSKMTAQFLPKELVFRSDIFEGDWYYATTIASQNYANKGLNGWMSTADEKGVTSSKVHSIKKENGIDFINLNIDERLRSNLTDRSENQSIVLSLPAEFVDYRMGLDGKGTGVKEEATTDLAWDKRQYVKLKFEEKNTELQDIQLDDGYISFLMFDSTSKTKYRVALYNVAAYQSKNPPYTPKVYLREDRQVFGFFFETKNTIKTDDQFRREDFEKNTLVDRYNPQREKIVFSLNVGAPDWSVEVAQRAVDAWDQAFRQAGISTKVELAKERAEIGDLRTNVINLIGDIDGSEPYWGVAPKIVDPDTGEIISSTTNVNLMSIVYTGDGMVEQYLRTRAGSFNKNYIFGLPLPSLQLFNGQTPSETLAKIETSDLRFDQMKFSTANSTTGKILKNALVFDASKAKQNFKSLGSLSTYHHEASFEQVNNSVIPELESQCPQIKALGDQAAKGETIDKTTAEFKKLKRACSMEISKTRVLSTMIHEMGHNFGLRHNFRGSTDWRNYFQGANEWQTIIDPNTGKLNLPKGVTLGAPVKYKGTDGQERTAYLRSSSVMEYTTYNHDTMIVPGPYDVAALRWAYTGKVLDQNDKLMDVSDQKPILKQVEKTMRRFAYCTDEDIDVYGRDALCIRQDEGLTPSAIVTNLVMQFNSYIASSYQKLDRDKLRLPPEVMGERFFKYTATPLLRIYQEWRTMLASEIGFSNAYLEKMSTEEYLRFLDSITTVTPKMGPEERNYRNNLADFRKAADLAYAFLIGLAFQPDYTCIVDRGTEKGSDVVLKSFASLQRNIFDLTGGTAKSCKDEVVTNFLQQLYGKNTKVLASGGLSSLDLRYDLSQSAIEDGPDRIGILPNKVMALNALTFRGPLTASNSERNFLPNFLDEPHYRESFQAMVTERLQLGLDISAFGLKYDKVNPSPLFENEKDYLSFLFASLKEGLQIPGKPEVSNKRQEVFTVLPSYYGAFQDMSQVRCARLQSVSYCAGPENTVARSLLDSLSRIQTMRDIKMPTDESVKLFLTVVKPLIPAQAVSDKTTFTGAQFQKVLGAIQAKIEELKKAKQDAQADDLSYAAAVLLDQEMKILNSSFARRLQKANQESLSDREFTAKQEQIYNLDVVKAAKDTMGDDGKFLQFTLSYPELERRTQQLGNNIQKMKAIYELDKTEYDAQADMLMQTIFFR